MSSIQVIVLSFVMTMVHLSFFARASPCITTGGSPCIFPFKARGVLYSKCTQAGGFTTPWCATATDTNGDIVLGSWGDCPATPGCISNTTISSSSQTTKTSCKTISGAQAGAPCVFPFIARGVEYSSCTYAGGYSTPWCATQIDAKGNNVLGNWGNCPLSEPCLEGPWGSLDSNGYVPKGEVIKVDDLDLYIVGSSEKCIIWNYDISGFDGGRTKLLADLFAEEGFMVIIPDFFRGTSQNPILPGAVEFLIKNTNWSKLVVDWENIILPFAKEKGATSFGSIGTCWGSYMVLRESAYDEMKVGVIMHPSHTAIIEILGENETDLLESVKCPQLWMPAGSDAAETKLGGLAQQVMGDKLEIIEFNEMRHGWTTRGDMSDEKVNRDVNKAIKAALDFIKKRL